MSYRILAFLFITFVTYFGLWWCALPVVFVYIYKYPAYDLIAAAIILDAGFGAFSNIPYYSISMLLLVTVVEYVKPALMFYTEHDALS